jgi:hypothetical protein
LLPRARSAKATRVLLGSWKICAMGLCVLKLMEVFRRHLLVGHQGRFKRRPGVGSHTGLSNGGLIEEDQ